MPINFASYQTGYLVPLTLVYSLKEPGVAMGYDWFWSLSGTGGGNFLPIAAIITKKEFRQSFEAIYKTVLITHGFILICIIHYRLSTTHNQIAPRI